MKRLFVTIALSLMTLVAANAQNYWGTSSRSKSTTSSSVRYQQSYTRSDGTYVQGHYKTNSNHTNHDNFSTVGNVNVYTGSTGSRAKDYSPSAYNYGSGRTVYTGPRGGQYYINSNGNKTYIPKR